MKISKAMTYILILLFNLLVFSQSFAHCHHDNNCSTELCETDPCKADTHKNKDHKEDRDHENPCSHLSDACFCPIIDSQKTAFHEQSIQLFSASFSKDDVKVNHYPAFYKFVLINSPPRINNSLYILQSKLIC